MEFRKLWIFALLKEIHWKSFHFHLYTFHWITLHHLNAIYNEDTVWYVELLCSDMLCNAHTSPSMYQSKWRKFHKWRKRRELHKRREFHQWSKWTEWSKTWSTTTWTVSNHYYYFCLFLRSPSILRWICIVIIYILRAHEGESECRVSTSIIW